MGTAPIESPQATTSCPLLNVSCPFRKRAAQRTAAPVQTCSFFDDHVGDVDHERDLDHTVLPAAAESALDAARIAADPGHGLVLILSDGTHVQLPEQIRAVLRDAATPRATGQAVSITPINTVLTTQQAAVLLGVTRPTLVRLLESGAIPFTQPGRHRRVQLADLVGYQARQRADGRAELSKMTTDTTDQELHRAGFVGHQVVGIDLVRCRSVSSWMPACWRRICYAMCCFTWRRTTSTSRSGPATSLTRSTAG
jgi:excisionase family DNA binding protein